jgi:hypothetical protein
MIFPLNSHLFSSFSAAGRFGVIPLTLTGHRDRNKLKTNSDSTAQNISCVVDLTYESKLRKLGSWNGGDNAGRCEDIIA